MQRFAAIVRLALFLALAACLGYVTGAIGDTTRQSPQRDSIASVSLADLPPEAIATLRLIQRGGPFPYPHKDGSTFNNFEKRLPPQIRGYYREYTVPTPGRRDRGARRLIAGMGPRGDVGTSGEYYYTEDHYRHFRRIIQP